MKENKYIKRKYVKEFEAEPPALLEGLYADFDSKILHAMVRDNQPLSILECGPRTGKTTSVIINALIKNIEETNGLSIDYYIFEKELKWLNAIANYCDNFKGINFHYNCNLLDFNYEKMPQLDFLFLDANHDYILAKWYIKYLFPKVSDTGIIHIHDIYYNRHGNGWDDALFANTSVGVPRHPDYIDINILKGFYGDVFDEFFDGNYNINRDEANEIADYVKEHPELDFISTLELDGGEIDVPYATIPPCSLYLIKKKNEE